LKENIIRKYLETILTFEALAHSVGLSITPAQAKDISEIRIKVAATDLPACPSLFRCVDK